VPLAAPEVASCVEAKTMANVPGRTWMWARHWMWAWQREGWTCGRENGVGGPDAEPSGYKIRIEDEGDRISIG